MPRRALSTPVALRTGAGFGRPIAMDLVDIAGLAEAPSTKGGRAGPPSDGTS
jgi:hypothetical protein